MTPEQKKILDKELQREQYRNLLLFAYAFIPGWIALILLIMYFLGYRLS